MMDRCNLDLCTGCEACCHICPTKAITMTDSEDGFRYPVINKTICRECGLCTAVCPLNSKMENDFEQKYYCAKAKEQLERRTSQSGGMCACLAEKTLLRGGVVYGCALNEALKAEHIRVQRKQDLFKLKGSKYVQSDISKIYSTIIDDINNLSISRVLFFGTPCQIAGIKSFLQKKSIDLKKLYCVDIICHGVPSPKIYADYLNHCYKSVKSYNFRDKIFGWSSHIESIETKRCVIHSERFVKLFYSNLILRKSCYECKFCTFNRCSDLTCADFWNYRQSGISYDSEGISEVLINSSKGLGLFDEIRKELNIMEISKGQADQHNLNAPTILSKPSMRDDFWKEYKNEGIDYIVKKYAKESVFDRAKLKLFYCYKKIKRKFKNGSDNDL